MPQHQPDRASDDSRGRPEEGTPQMAVSKKELSVLTDDELLGVDAEERKIDAWLRTRPLSRWYARPDHLNRAQKDELLSRYHAEDWTVREIDDQRDGAAWIFE